jgi:hypothetical protein
MPGGCVSPNLETSNTGPWRVQALIPDVVAGNPDFFAVAHGIMATHPMTVTVINGNTNNLVPMVDGLSMSYFDGRVRGMGFPAMPYGDFSVIMSPLNFDYIFSESRYG